MRHSIKQFTQEVIDYIEEYIRYDRDLGKLFYKKTLSSRAIIGNECGTKRKNYVVITIFGRKYLIHRIIFFLERGYCPIAIDHVDGNGLNNFIENLRECSFLENQGNRKNHGKYLKGVRYDKRTKTNPWLARIHNEHIGCFPTEEAAHEAYRKAAIHYFGNFAKFE